MTWQNYATGGAALFLVLFATSERFLLAAGVTVAVLAIAWATVSEQWAKLVALARPLLARLRRREETAVNDPFVIQYGVDPVTRQPLTEGLPRMEHIGVFTLTGGGKTTLLRALIHELIKANGPDRLKLIISDPKTLDYAFYSRLAHLLCPIARNEDETTAAVALAEREMERRKEIIRPYAEKQPCNSIEDFARITGVMLPRIVIVLDEMSDVISKQSPLEESLIRIGQLGRAFGIHIIGATQRPTAKNVSGELKANLTAKFVGFMTDNSEYGNVAKVPKAMYTLMQNIPGRWMVVNRKGWHFCQGLRIGDRELVKVAQHYSRPNAPVWNGELEAIETRPKLRGSQAEKDSLFGEWLNGFARKPTAEEVMEYWGCSKPTALGYLGRLWSE